MTPIFTFMPTDVCVFCVRASDHIMNKILRAMWVIMPFTFATILPSYNLIVMEYIYITQIFWPQHCSVLFKVYWTTSNRMILPSWFSVSAFSDGEGSYPLRSHVFKKLKCSLHTSFCTVKLSFTVGIRCSFR